MKLQLDPALDLGKHTEWMTPEDKRRQEASVNAILRAFSDAPKNRREIQLLADEVGMGKTFVALATAYRWLRMVRWEPAVANGLNLRKCYRAVVVVVPSGNHALAKKWNQEVEALRTRCSVDARQTDWFHSRICENAYDLAEGLQRASDLRRDPRKNPCVLICTANVFRRRVGELNTRLRFLAACLFRWWGNKLSRHERYRIISRAAEVSGFSDWAESAQRVGTGEYEVDLWNFREHEQYLTLNQHGQSSWPREQQSLYQSATFTYTDLVAALERLEGQEEGHTLLFEESESDRNGVPEPKGLLPFCKNAAERRGYAGWYFEGFKIRLLKLYKLLAPFLIGKNLPLVIVDEAHHWRHAHRQDCQDFHDHLAPKCQRLLMLTATPFQLHRDELSVVLSVGDKMAAAIGTDRVSHLKSLREGVHTAMATSESAGLSFSREWGMLTDQLIRLDKRFDPAQGWLPSENDPRTAEIAQWWQVLTQDSAGDLSSRLALVPGVLRPFFARALDLIAANHRLRTSMSQLIIRHRRGVAHRRVWIGREYPPETSSRLRPDQHLLHMAPGAVVPPDAELSQYLLMKVVAEASRGKHRTTLGMDLTGCFTTLWQSREGAKASAAALSGASRGLLQLLQKVTGYHPDRENREDGRHPKVQRIVHEVLRRWDHGEKSLIFCFRVPTAKTLSRLLSRGVEQRLRKSRRQLFESRGTVLTERLSEDRAMQSFRRSLTARESSGVPLFLDRVLLGWFQINGLPLPQLTDEDRHSIANLYARTRIHNRSLFVREDRARYDRVFLNRAIEHVWAVRLLSDKPSWSTGADTSISDATLQLLEMIANPVWIQFRYGQEDLGQKHELANDQQSTADTVARSTLSAIYELRSDCDPSLPQLILKDLERISRGGQASLLETLTTGPNLLVPLGPAVSDLLDADGLKRTGEMLKSVFSITFFQGEWCWKERANVLDAIVRALLRDDILLRLPRSVFRDDAETWAASILRGLHAPPGGGLLEPLAGRVEEFLRELNDMGPSEREAHLRYALKANAEAVKLVAGSSNSDDRDAVFNGFNTPLLPDILVCTQVGQEGIDLHRHCRHVIHYDLGWNPATLEQRTGRTDRIGSKTFRERKLKIKHRMGEGRDSSEADLPGLDVALPYLAGTYDERMFDRLRSRSQAFEILTGGDPTADRDSESSWLDPDDVGAATGVDYVALPPEMLDQLRVNLSVV